MKALGTTAITLLIAGAGTAGYAWATWPKWNPTQAYVNATTILGDNAIDPNLFNLPPADYYTTSLITLTIGLSLIGIGILAGLLAMHAAEVRNALAPTLETTTPSVTPLPPPVEVPSVRSVAAP